jgi:hypothetical protein
MTRMIPFGTRVARAIAMALVVIGLSGMVGVAPAGAATFGAGNVVVYRVGDGSGSLVNTGNQVFLDEYTPTGTLVQSIPMPTVASGANKPLVASGTATSEGLLTRSPDGAHLALTGYGSTLPGASSLANSTSANVPRVVGIVDAAGNVDTTTALGDFSSGNNPRSAVTTNGTDIWIGGASTGIAKTTLGSLTSTSLGTTPVTNIRQVNIFGGQLFSSDSSGSAVRVGSVGLGLPTTSPQTITNLPGIPTSGSPSPSPYAFVFLAVGGGATPDTLYVAEDTLSGGLIQKYCFSSGTWTAEGTVAAAAVRGLTGSLSGSTVTLFGTTGGMGATGGGSLYNFTDSTGLCGVVSGSASTIATAAANEAFRGVAFAPVAPGSPPVTPEVPYPALLAVAGLGIGGIVLGLRRRTALRVV